MNYCEEARLDSLQKENEELKKELAKRTEQIRIIESDNRDLKELIIKMLMRQFDYKK